jgi:hypothetical protein
LIAAARSDAGERVHPRFPGRFLTALGARLEELTLQEVVDFDARRHKIYKRADRPGLRAANRLIGTTVGDLPEPSSAFLSGLVSLGRESFERALSDADSLSWEPVMSAIAKGQLPADHLLMADLTALAGEVYASRSDANGVFYRLVSARLYPDEDADQEYDDADNGAQEVPWDDDPAQVQARLPKLGAMFAPHTAAAEEVKIRRRHLSAVGWTVLFAMILIAAIVISLIGQVLDG